MADPSGSCVLPPAQLYPQRCQAREHPSHGARRRQTVRLWLREDAQSGGELHGLCGHQVVQGSRTTRWRHFIRPPS
uniref:Uncharacterized protein n=1 Tax=Timema bartmani TaxID=61472 RepID=A0A7R9FC53_9NEOP|nr:unnamed protein product [Timema bartmani]